MSSPHTTAKRSPGSQQVGKAWAQQPRPSIAKNRDKKVTSHSTMTHSHMKQRNLKSITLSERNIRECIRHNSTYCEILKQTKLAYGGGKNEKVAAAMAGKEPGKEQE